MDFNEIVCYSQTIILVLLLVGSLLNFRKDLSSTKEKVVSTCPSCGYEIDGSDVQYCAKCGNMLSQSEGLKLEK